LPFAMNCRIPLWRNEGHIDASIGIAFIFMATCGIHLSYPSMPLSRFLKMKYSGAPVNEV
jgi:hypothetical protein